MEYRNLKGYQKQLGYKIDNAICEYPNLTDSEIVQVLFIIGNKYKTKPKKDKSLLKY